MPSDYDLVVLGGSIEGRIAAMTAVKYGARVALVETPGLFEQRQRKRYLLHALQQLGKGAQQQAVMECFWRGSTAGRDWDWGRILEWSAIASTTQNPELSLAAMSISGVDVVLEMPERLSRQLLVTTATRKLRARGVLAAFSTVPLPTAAESSLSSPTGIDLLFNVSALPQSVTILGDSVEAVMWAEALCLLGVQVTLVAEQFLRYEDWTVRALVRSQLTTSGVNILSSSEAPKDLTPENALLFGTHQPALVLPDFVQYQTGLKEKEIYLSSNHHLQTSHPRIFACGSLISGFPVHERVAIAEAKTAVQNALFLPTRQMRYGKIPEGYGRFARVGLTPRFAREGRMPTRSDRGYGLPEDWQMWTASSYNSTDLSQTVPWPLYCKLICYDGRVQSLHLLGEGASELIQPLAMSIGKPIGSVMAELTGADGLAGVVKEGVAQSQQYKWQPSYWRRDWAENWFNWRRSR